VDLGLVLRRGLAGAAAVSIAVGFVTILGAPAATAAVTAVTCPTVSSTGVVTPAPTSGVDWSGCDLSQANLSGADLNAANLSAADLSGADLSKASLSGSNLSSANLSSANLASARMNRTTLTGANLSGAAMGTSLMFMVATGQLTGTPAALPANWLLADGYLVGPGSNLENASLAGSNLSGADIQDSMITAADLSDADLANADFTAAQLGGSDLAGANLTDANLDTFYVSDLTLTGANLSGTKFMYDGDLTGVVSGGITGTPANLPYYPNGQYVLGGGYLAGPGADLANTDLAGVDLSGAYLTAGANLSGADLNGTNLSDGALAANIAGAELAGANLTDIASDGDTGTPASLPEHWAYVDGYLLGPTVEAIYANLSSANLSGLDLENAQFNYANLSSANLDAADLASTYLWFANLTGATVAGTNFTGASWNSTTCPDGTNSNMYIAGCFSPRDTTPPVLHLNVKNGQVFAVGSAPEPQCTATDEYSTISTQPTLTITSHSKHGLGNFTATCSGGTDLAGLTASPVTATYWVAYGFDGMQPQQGAYVPTRPRTLVVSFSLSGATGGVISASTGKAMARRHDVRVTLRGPGTRPVTAVCRSYSLQSGFTCKLRLPHGIKTGRRHRYTITAYENNGFGFVVAPGEPTAENPVSIHFN
jgi:uncharacterized protein YjbI with pentapeptide repeats